MSLLRFSFTKKSEKPDIRPNVPNEAHTVSTTSSSPSRPMTMSTGAVAAVHEGTALSEPVVPISSVAVAPQRDPAMPATLSVDDEIRLGPVVMDCSNNHSGRGFRKQWTLTRDWLEYSNSNDSAYCFPCRLFGKTMSTAQIRGHDAFVSKGWNDWKNALSSGRGLGKHEASALHQTCSGMLANRRSQLNDPDAYPCIEASLSAAFRERQQQLEKERQVNRQYIGRLSVVMRFLMRLGLSFRGHRESEDSLHRGNFRELIELLRVSDDFLDSQIRVRPGNAHYLSPEIQNQLIDAIGDEVLCCIVKKIREADYFAVMMDETTDLAHMEQVAIVVRFCDSDFNAYERLLSLTESSTVTGERLAEILLSTLERHNLDTQKLIAQTYDGAASMSGHNRGVQAIIRQTAPQAHFNHCRSHSCNLVIVKCVHSTTFGRTYFGVLEQLFVFIEGSARRHSWFMEAQKTAGLVPKPLKGLSDTRWNCQGRSVEVVRSRLAAVNEALSKIRDESVDRKAIGEAIGLLACINKFEFAIATVFFSKLLSPLDTLTTAIQGPDATLHTVVCLSQSAVACLQDLRDNFDEVFDSATQLADDNGIESTLAISRARKVSRKLDDGANEVILSAKDKLKQELTEIVDVALSELKVRFYDKCCKLYSLVGILMNAATDNQELYSCIEELYPGVDADLATSQFDIVRRIPAWIAASSLQERARACPPSMGELRKLYKIMITVPVTSAECERTFSKLALIKNKLRSTCGQQRLEKLVLCCVERDILLQAEDEKIIDRFSAMQEGRRIRLN